MKNKKAAQGAPLAPVTYGQAAKLLGTSVSVVTELVGRMELFFIEADGERLIPVSELRRFLPRR